MGSMKILAALLVVVVLLASPVYADTGTLSQIKERSELRVGIKTDSPPFGFVDGHGENRGFDVDVTKTLARRLFGSTLLVRFVPVTPEDGIDLLNTGMVDIIVGPAATAARARESELTIPYFVTGHLILVRRAARPIVLRDLRGKKIGVVEGSTSDSMAMAPGATRVRFRTISDAVGALRKGNLDAIVGQDEMLFSAEKAHPELVMADWRPFGVERCCFAARKGEVDLSRLLSDGLKGLVQTTEYRGLLEKWFGLSRAFLYERTLAFEMEHKTSSPRG